MPTLTFPTFNNGVISQYPYGEADLYFTTQSYMPCGFAYTKSWNANAPQKQFLVHFETMNKTEMQTLEAFFSVTTGGQTQSFSFTDDAGVTHANCVFDQPSLEFKYSEPGAYGVDVKILSLS